MCLTAPTFQIAPVGPYKSLRNTSQLDCACVNEHEEGLVLSSKMIERGRARPAAPPSGSTSPKSSASTFVRGHALLDVGGVVDPSRDHAGARG